MLEITKFLWVKERSLVVTTLLRKFAFLTCLLAVSFSIPLAPLWAAEVDFSCVSSKVKGKTQVNANHKEYDIVIENRCPGPVYWSMCIERMDPWTNEVKAALTPSGILKVGKKAKVNLQTKKRLDATRSRQDYQEFYLDIGYAIKPPAKARCVASGCESKRRSLRTKFRANDAAWQKANKTLVGRISTECPQSGWDNSEQEVCAAKIRNSAQGSMDRFIQEEKELKSRMATIDPEQCQVYGGD